MRDESRHFFFLLPSWRRIRRGAPPRPGRALVLVDDSWAAVRQRRPAAKRAALHGGYSLRTRKELPPPERWTNYSTSAGFLPPCGQLLEAWLDRYVNGDAMATVRLDHYRAYAPKALHPRRARLGDDPVRGSALAHRANFTRGAGRQGYKAQILPVATKDDLVTGREVADMGSAAPTSFTTGNLVNFLKKKLKQTNV